MKWLVAILFLIVFVAAVGSQRGQSGGAADRDWCDGMEIQAIAAGQVDIGKKLKSRSSAEFGLAVGGRIPKDAGCLWFVKGKGSAVNDFNVRKDFEWAAFVRFQSRNDSVVEKSALGEV